MPLPSSIQNGGWYKIKVNPARGCGSPRYLGHSANYVFVGPGDDSDRYKWQITQRSAGVEIGGSVGGTEARTAYDHVLRAGARGAIDMGTTTETSTEWRFEIAESTSLPGSYTIRTTSSNVYIAKGACTGDVQPVNEGQRNWQATLARDGTWVFEALQQTQSGTAGDDTGLTTVDSGTDTTAGTTTAGTDTTTAGTGTITAGTGTTTAGTGTTARTAGNDTSIIVVSVVFVCAITAAAMWALTRQKRRV